MIVYWILFLSIVLIQIFHSDSERFVRFRLIFSFVLIFGYASLRGNGFDYEAYEDAFDDIHLNYGSTSFESRMESGFVWLNLVMPSYRFLLVFLSAFTCITYYLLFRFYIPSKYYWLGFVLLALFGDKMLLFQLSGLRNSIGINIMTLSIPLILRRKLFFYMVLTIIAYSFHNSVLFFMPLAYFVATPSKIKIVNVFAWCFVFLFFIVFSTSSLLDSVSSFINTYFDRYSTYTDVAQDLLYDRSILLYGFNLTVIAMTFNFSTKMILTESQNVIVKLSLLFLVSLMLGVLNFRMSQFFAPYLLLSCFVFLESKTFPILKYCYLLIIALFLSYSLFFVYLGRDDVSSYQYRTIFEL